MSMFLLIKQSAFKLLKTLILTRVCFLEFVSFFFSKFQILVYAVPISHKPVILDGDILSLSYVANQV